MELIKKNIKRGGITNEIICFSDGKKILDFLFPANNGSHLIKGGRYLLLLDIKMPKDNGVEILKRIKKDKILKMMPGLMLTTTDDPEEVNRCYSLGCSNYITKPVKYSKFVEIIKLLGIVINLVAVPKLSVEKQLL